MSQSLNQHWRLSLLATAVVVALVMVTGCAEGPPATEALKADEGAESVVLPTPTPDPGVVQCEPNHVIVILTFKNQVTLMSCEVLTAENGQCIGFTNATGVDQTVTVDKGLFESEQVLVPANGSASRKIIADPIKPNPDMEFPYQVGSATCYETEATPRIIVKASTD